jgi:hypothetical protein
MAFNPYDDPTPAEVAREFGLSHEIVRLWCSQGWRHKLGPRNWRVPCERVDAILAARSDAIRAARSAAARP